MRLWTARLVACGALALAPAAHAQTPRADSELTEAKRLEAQLEYEPALVIVERVIASGGASVDQLVERHLLAGRLAAGLDRTGVAEEHFARVLALAPATTLPDGTSPKLTGPFDAARARTARLRVRANLERDGAGVIVEADSLGLVTGVAVVLQDGRERRAPTETRIPLPTGTRIRAVIALDAFGNALWLGDVAPGTNAPRPTVVVDYPPPPLYRRWFVWAAVSGVALAVGAGTGVAFRNEQDRWNQLAATGTADYTELRDIEARGRAYALSANLSFGVSIVAGITGAIMLATRPSGPTVMPVGSRDGGGLVVTGRF